MKVLRLLATCLLVAIGMNPSLVEAAETFTLSDTLAVNTVTDVVISSDGQTIAYTKRRPRTPYEDDNGKAYQELFVIKGRSAAQAFVSGDVTVSNIQFSPDNKSIYYLAKRFEDKHQQLYRIPVDGGESEKVFTFKSNIAGYTIDKDQKTLVFWAKDIEPKHEKKLKEKGFLAKVYEESNRPNLLWQLDLAKKDAKATKVNFSRHILSAEFSPLDKRLLVSWTENPLIDEVYVSQRISLVMLNGKIIATIPTEGKLGAKRWSKDAKSIAFIGAEDRHDPASGRLKVYDIASEKVTELMPGLLGHVSDIAWDDKGQLLYVADIGVETEVGRFDVKTKKKTIVRKAGDGIVSRVVAAMDRTRMVVLLNSFKHPSEVFELAARSGSTTRLTDSNPWLANKKFANQEVFNAKARDGLELQGILIKPLNFDKNKRYPLIMFVHGGPEAHLRNGWINRYSEPTQVVAAKGYVAFYPNYRGSTGRGVEFSKMGQGDYAGAEFNDLIDLKEKLVKMGLVDKKRVGITGGSYGGYASAWGATALSEHYAASVMFVGISNQISKFGTTDIPEEMHNVHARSWPWDDKWQWMMERSPVYHVKKAKTPLLILHGEEDTRVHPSQSMELYRYVKTATDTPVRLVFYPGEGHGNRKAGSQMDYGLRMIRWMDNYLMDGGKAMPPYELDHHLKLKKSEDEEE